MLEPLNDDETPLDTPSEVFTLLLMDMASADGDAGIGGDTGTGDTGTGTGDIGTGDIGTGDTGTGTGDIGTEEDSDK